MENSKGFESKTCGRCGGGGHYSYCQRFGTVCFGCSGSGKQYTKRGLAAIAYARKLRTVKVSDLRAGMLMFVQDTVFGQFKAGWYEIESITPSESCQVSKQPDGSEVRHYYTDIKTRVLTTGTFADAEVQAIESKDRLAEIRKLALEYQDTLTERGTVRKRKAAKKSLTS
jgi:hypothetical protein